MQERTFWGAMIRRFQKNKMSATAAVVVVILVLVAIFAPQLSTHNPNRQEFDEVLQPPSGQHWFGTDEVGRDIYSRILYGARISFTVGILAVGLGALVGVSLGLFAGYRGGSTDSAIMRIVDILLAFPGILLALLIAATLGAGLGPVIIAVAFYSVPTFARLTRGTVLTIKEREYVEAARAAGAEDVRIIVRHVLLNSFGPILVYATLLMGSAILTAASLSFLGVGVPPPTPEWGAMISTARNHMRMYPHVIIFPGLAIFITVLAFNILGDALRDIFDPKSLQ